MLMNLTQANMQGWVWAETTKNVDGRIRLEQKLDETGYVADFRLTSSGEKKNGSQPKGVNRGLLVIGETYEPITDTNDLSVGVNSFGDVYSN